jgi:6-phosphofructokinase 1
MPQETDFRVPSLGECLIPSPLTGIRFVRESERVLYDSDPDRVKAALAAGREPWSFEAGGPRERIFFAPTSQSCGIVTCGGLCPGLNDVIRATVMSLHYHYGVRTIYGFRFGYEGLCDRYGHEPVRLTPDMVLNIGEEGGTILGSSRGQQDVGEMVDTLARMNIGILFAIGGDGTLRGALAIHAEARRRGLRLSVIGIPKTIDNDVSFVQKTFGFETAVSEATRAASAAHAEAQGARNGVGLVKLMGRDSGFIAAYTALAENNIDFCLVPEVPFALDALLAALQRRLERRGHAVIVVAEGAGQGLASPSGDRDRSGNVRYGDIGIRLRDAITHHFKAIGAEINVKYIDPSYSIRSVPAIPHDSAFCLVLAHAAVHAGMAGRTGMVVGFWNHRVTHVPIPLAVLERKRIDPEGSLWSSVLTSTGQPLDLTGAGTAAVAAGRGPV